MHSVEQLLNRELAVQANAGSEGRSAGTSLRMLPYVLAGAVCYYVATQIAWMLCFPDSKVSLFFPPHAVLLCILLLVPTPHWWAYVLAAASAHFLATQQAHWPLWYALTCEAFDAAGGVSREGADDKRQRCSADSRRSQAPRQFDGIAARRVGF